MTLPTLSAQDIENICYALDYITPHQFMLLAKEAERLGREYGYGVILFTIERGRGGAWHPRYIAGAPTFNFPKEEAG